MTTSAPGEEKGTRDVNDSYLTVRYGDIDVCWLPELDGGGMRFGQDYLPLVATLFGKVGRAAEVCAGPGFIGFSLLARGLCDSLVLTDVNPVAVAAARETVRRNGLEDRVSVYLSDGLDDIPADERWDLVVSNPPHFAEPVGVTYALLTDDIDWRMHRAFFGKVARFLAPGGSVLWQKNSVGAEPGVFLPMIEAGGLRTISTFWYTPTGNTTLYYLWAQAAAPDIVVDDGASAPVVVPLTDGATEVHTLPGRSAHALRLVNRTGRPVSVWVTGERDPLPPVVREFLPLKVAADGGLTLPRMALSPGSYAVVDDDGDPGPDSVLARVHVPG